jgi:hypothetical protein
MCTVAAVQQLSVPQHGSSCSCELLLMLCTTLVHCCSGLQAAGAVLMAAAVLHVLFVVCCMRFHIESAQRQADRIELRLSNLRTCGI